MKGKKFIILVTALAALGLASVFGVGLLLASQVGRRPAVGALAPDFSMPLYPDYRGTLKETVRLSELRGKVVVINFWASWCTECRLEAPGLEATYRRYKDRRVVFLGVDYLDTEPAALAYLREFDITYANGIDLQQQIARSYRITGVPETFVVDKRGVIRFIAIQRVTPGQLTDVIDPLLAE
jgi:cytochrome c biogenesis protein CcmG/thiol:disulfide interchange protein DsbE